MLTDATKAMQQLDGLDIAGSRLSVKISSVMPATDAAANLVVGELDEEGKLLKDCQGIRHKVPKLPSVFKAMSVCRSYQRT